MYIYGIKYIKKYIKDLRLIVTNRIKVLRLIKSYVL
jgi:hypothetical protein